MQIKVNQIIQGDCVEVMNAMPAACVDLVFADPPYNLQLRNQLHRPNMTRVNTVDDSWDQFESFADYDAFTQAWLAACKRILKPTGTIWVIGSYHNIFRVGRIMQDLGFWILNDVIWIKNNPMPNFKGVRFTNAHETLIWASTGKDQRYTFNHQGMKGLNEEKQMRSDWWQLPLTPKAERVRDQFGHKAHSTQKPEALLYRVIVSSTNPGDLVLDPFFGSGTAGVVAKRLHRDWIGIELERDYIDVAHKRIAATEQELFDAAAFDIRSLKKLAPRIPFSALLEYGYLRPGQQLFFHQDRSRFAYIKPDARLVTEDGFVGSIHNTGTHYMDGSPCNGWEHWYLEEQGTMVKLDDLRQRLRSKIIS